MKASPAGLVILGLVAGSALGYGFGQLMVESDSRGASTIKGGGTDQMVQALVADRDAWKRRALAAEAEPNRVAVRSSGTRGSTSPMVSDIDRMSGAMNSGGTKPAAGMVKPEKPDPAKAKRLLNTIEEALVAGDAAALDGALLAEVGKQAALMVPDLVSKLASAESLFAKEQLAKMLGELGDARALAPLQTLLRSESDDAVRTAAVRALGAIPDESSVDLLTEEFRRASTSPMPPSLAATSLGNIGSDKAIAALKAEIDGGGNGMVRAFALNALAARKSKELAPYFVDQIKRPGVSDRYRRSAIDALVSTGDQASVFALKEIALSPQSSKSIREAAKRAVNKLSGKRVFDVR